MPEGTQLDPRSPGADQPVQPPTERLQRGLGAPGVLMTQARFLDRWRHFKAEPQQVSGASMLYDAIAQGWPPERILDEEADWARRFSEAPPVPPAPTFSNPLNVKYQSQNDNLSGTGWRECFSSSMAMIAMYWGKVKNDDEYNKVRARFGDTTDAGAQIRALQELGLSATFIQNGSVQTLEREINEGRPVGVGWLHHGPVSNPSGGGHWSVVVGYNDTHWIHNDPNGVADLVNGGYTNNWNGEMVSYSRKNWQPRWLVYSQSDGWAMLVRP